MSTVTETFTVGGNAPGSFMLPCLCQQYDSSQLTTSQNGWKARGQKP